MRKYVFGVGALVVPTLLGATLTAGCSEDGTNPLGTTAAELCGPCGKIVDGDVSIAGDARLDGLFKALGQMSNVTTSIQADFEGNIRALAAVYGVELDGAINAAAVAELTAAIEADIDANVEGGLVVTYQPPRCQANVNIAVEAQARCEAKAECNVSATPGELAVSCEGTCTGSCEGSCEGDFSCEIQAPSIQCEGRCEGSCVLEAGATCEGTCRGECDGTCSAQDAEGNCAGQCDGECTGTCELSAAAECSGTCSGKCLVNQGSAQCTAEASCRGECTGECTGGCEGNFTPPQVDVDCEASAECQASAKAEANASLDCTPPQLDVDFVLSAEAQGDLDVQAAFTARLTELKARGAAIVQGAARFEALITGRVEGEVVFNPSPVQELRTSVQAFANTDVVANLNIAPGRLPCVIDAVAEAATMSQRLLQDTSATLQAQAAFVGAFTAGFDSGS